MARLPTLSGKQLTAILQREGFVIIRQQGSHVRMKHPDGRFVTTVTHKTIAKGTLRAIVRQAGLSVEDLLGESQHQPLDDAERTDT